MELLSILLLVLKYRRIIKLLSFLNPQLKENLPRLRHAYDYLYFFQ